MATDYPRFPVPHGEVAHIRNPSGAEYTIRKLDEGLWIVDHARGGTQSEVRALADGYFQVMHTNGVATQNMSFPSWREAMIYGF